MPTTSPPTRIVLYALATGRPEPVAVLRWRPGSDITLDVIDPVEGSVAQQYFDRGIVLAAERRLVQRSEPEAFMRALVQPHQSTYSRFVDESDRR
jgi:hypothetical protein